MRYIDLYKDEEIRNKFIDFILSCCDEIKFVTTDFVNDCYKVIPFENIKKSFIGKAQGSICGIDGICYSFYITNEIKELLYKINFNDVFVVKFSDEEKYAFENLMLCKNEQVIYSCCTHEGYENFSDDIVSKLSFFCEKEIKGTKTYINVENNYKKMFRKYSLVEIKNMIDRLWYIESYVAKANHAIIFQDTPYKDITFDEYLILAQLFFSDKLFSKIKGLHSFAEFPNVCYNQRLQDNICGKQFISTELGQEIYRELTLWKLYIKDKEDE